MATRVHLKLVTIDPLTAPPYAVMGDIGLGHAGAGSRGGGVLGQRAGGCAVDPSSIADMTP